MMSNFGIYPHVLASLEIIYIGNYFFLLDTTNSITWISKEKSNFGWWRCCDNFQWKCLSKILHTVSWSFQFFCCCIVVDVDVVHSMLRTSTPLTHLLPQLALPPFMLMFHWYNIWPICTGLCWLLGLLLLLLVSTFHLFIISKYFTMDIGSLFLPFMI